MAEHKIFVEDAKNKRIGASTTYTYDAKNREFILFWKGKKVQTVENVDEGEPIWVNCNGEGALARRLRLPNRRSSCLMWLLGFAKDLRAHSRDEYEVLYEQQLDENDWWNLQSYTTEGHGYAMSLCNRRDCGGVVYLAAYISDKAAGNRRKVKEILHQWQVYYPNAFVKKVLRERFKFTDEDIADVEDCLPY